MLHRNEKVELIKKIPLFAGGSKSELEQIAQIADEIDLREGKEMTSRAHADVSSSCCSRARPT